MYEFLTDAQLSTLKAMNIIKTSEPFNSVNNVLRNFTPKANFKDHDYISGFIDLNPVRNLYLSSSNFGNFNTTSITGDSTIIKKYQSMRVTTSLCSIMSFSVLTTSTVHDKPLDN